MQACEESKSGLSTGSPWKQSTSAEFCCVIGWKGIAATFCYTTHSALNPRKEIHKKRTWREQWFCSQLRIVCVCVRARVCFSCILTNNIIFNDRLISMRHFLHPSLWWCHCHWTGESGHAHSLLLLHHITCCQCGRVPNHTPFFTTTHHIQLF